MSQAWEAAVEAAAAARSKFWSSLGEPSADVLAPIINPIFMGGPPWPTRPAWRTIRRPTSTILVSEGLSDPWENGEALGQRLEVMIEVPEVLDEVKTSPFFSALVELSHLFASNDVRALLDELGFVSTEVSGDGFPKALQNEHGRVGFVLGVSSTGLPSTFGLPAGEARLVVATLLTRQELDAIVANSANRKAIGAALSARPGGQLSQLQRASVEFTAAPKKAPPQRKPPTTKQPISKASARKPARKPARPKTPASKKRSAAKPKKRPAPSKRRSPSKRRR